MASYDLTFLLDRVERARRLLSQDSHRGDADLQHFVADMEAVTALLELFLNDEGTAPQQGLTERQKYQGIFTLLKGLFHKMQLHNNIFVMPLPLARAIYQVLEDMECIAEMSPAHGLLYSLASMALLVHRAPQTPDPYAPTAVRAAGNILPPFGETTAGKGVPRPLQQLLELQRHYNLSTQLTASQIHETCLLVVDVASRAQLNLLQPLPPAREQELEQALLAAATQLVALNPRSPSYRLRLCTALQQLGRRQEWVATAEATVEAGRRQRADAVESEALGLLVYAHVCGARSSRFFVAALQGMLAQARAAAARCKPWMVTSLYAGMQDNIKTAAALLASALAASQPDERGMVPAVPPNVSLSALPETFRMPVCAMCRSASQLKKCSKCRAVAYCSRECQVRHWREGGHKAECSRLAAERRK